MKFADHAGSFWTEDYVSNVPREILKAMELVCRGITAPGTRVGDGVLAIFPLNTSERKNTLTAAPNGLGVGYPVIAQVETPEIIAVTATDGPLLFKDVDFSVTGGYVWFNVDPLSYAVVADKTALTSTGASSAVWAVHPGVPLADTRPTTGTYNALTAAIARATDTPRFTVTSTVVDVQQLENDQWTVVTEDEAFLLGDGVTPAAVLAAGVTVTKGDPVTNAWRLVRLAMPLTEPNYAVGLTALPATVTADIVWPNSLVATTVDTVDGITRIRFPLGGTLGDVTAFWTAAHEQAVAGRTSVAHMLDLRANPYGEPTVTDLPTQVNPAQVLCEQFVCGCGYMLIMDSAEFGENAMGAAERKLYINNAAGTLCAVFEFDGGVPATTPVL